MLLGTSLTCVLALCARWITCLKNRRGCGWCEKRHWSKGPAVVLFAGTGRIRWARGAPEVVLGIGQRVEVAGV